MVVEETDNIGIAAKRWWGGGAWDCWDWPGCPGLAHIWALARVLNNSSGWSYSGGGVRKEVDVDVLVAWCWSLKWLHTFSMFERQIDYENFEMFCPKKSQFTHFSIDISYKKIENLQKLYYITIVMCDSQLFNTLKNMKNGWELVEK